MIADRRHVHARVYLNTRATAIGYGYSATDLVTAAEGCAVDTAGSPVDVLYQAFDLFNAAHDLYSVSGTGNRLCRREGHRAAGIGDVVACGDRFHAIAHDGWNPIAPPLVATPHANPACHTGSRGIASTWDLGGPAAAGWTRQAALVVRHHRFRGYIADLHLHVTGRGQTLRVGARPTPLLRDRAVRFRPEDLGRAHAEALHETRRRFDLRDRAVSRYFTALRTWPQITRQDRVAAAP